MLGWCCKQIADGVETIVDALTRIGEIDVGACEDVVEFLGDFLGSLATLTANAVGAMSGIALLSLFMLTLSVAMGIIGSMDQTQIDAGIEAMHKLFKMIETTFIQNSDMYEKLPAIAAAISSAIIMLGIALVVGMASVLIGATLLVLAGSVLLLGSGLIQSGLQAFIDVMNEVGPQLPELGQQMVDLVLVGIQILLGGTILTIGSVLLLVGAAILLGAAAVLNSAMGVLQEALEQQRLDYITGNMGGIMLLGLQLVLAGALLLAGGLVFLIGSTIFSAAAKMFEIGAQSFETGVDSFCDGVDRIVETVETVRQAAEDFMSAGQNIMLGLNNGIADESDGVLETVGEVGADIIEGFCDLMGIHSPSDVFYEIGKFICEGLNIGVEENSGGVLDTIEDVGTSMVDTFTTTGTESGEGFGGGVTGIISTIGGLMSGELNFEDVISSFTNSGSLSGGGFLNSIISMLSGNEGTLTGSFANLGSACGVAFGNAVAKPAYDMLNQVKDSYNSFATQAQDLMSNGMAENINTTALGDAWRAMYYTQKGVDTLQEKQAKEIDDFGYGELDLSDYLSGLGGGVNSGGGGYTPVETEAIDYGSSGSGGYGGGTASDIASSSGAGTGINDLSQGGNTINSNNTYNFVQNNYSPEALDRTEIYQQTQYQLKSWYGWLQGNPM